MFWMVRTGLRAAGQAGEPAKSGQQPNRAGPVGWVFAIFLIAAIVKVYPWFGWALAVLFVIVAGCCIGAVISDRANRKAGAKADPVAEYLKDK